MATTLSPHPSLTSPSSPPTTSAVPARDLTPAERRHGRYLRRQAYSVLLSGGVGLLLGAYGGAGSAALRFRAENAHRLPTSTKGWYLYHKSKNYVAMWAGIKRGAAMSLRLALWTGAFVAVEESVDRCRYACRDDNDERAEGGDLLSSVVAGLAVAGGFSVVNRFPLATAGRTARLGLAVGAAYGALQDVFRVATGRRVGYVEAWKRWRGTSVASVASG